MTALSRWLSVSTTMALGILSLCSLDAPASGTTLVMQTDELKYDSVKIAQTLTFRFTTRYIEFHYSKAFAELDTIKALAETYDRFCDDAIRELALIPPSSRIRCFAYSSGDEMRQCLGIDGGGWAIIDEIHTLGLFPIQHECFHILFNGAVGHPKSAFFIEGIGQYFELTRDTQMVSRDLTIVRKYLDQPIESWANGTKGFWDSPQDGWITVTYSISGMFVRHLIQKFGLNRFKDFYRTIDDNATTTIADGFKRVYGSSLHEFINDFSNQMRSSP